MFVTVSRNSNILEKRFSKYLVNYLPDLSYIPRGKTPLYKIFKKAIYLGHKYFIVISSNDGKIIFSIFSSKQDSFFLEREYLIEVLDLRHLMPFSYISSINTSLNDSKEIFYFLSKKNRSTKSKYGVFKTTEENIFEFLEGDKYLGLRLKILDVKLFD